MLIIRTEGPDLVQQLDVSNDEGIHIILSDDEKLEKANSIKKQSCLKEKKVKKQEVKKIQCCNKLFKNLSFEDVPVIKNK